ncbi:YidC/Oxa1 family insertase periplasmic domain-containing protein, partial [Acinetobacter baumannii]
YPNLAGKDPSFFARTFGTSAKAGENYFDAHGGWLGFADHYWLAALIPDQNARVHSGFRGAPGDVYQADCASAPASIAPGHQVTQTSRFFAGA